MATPGDIGTLSVSEILCNVPPKTFTRKELRSRELLLSALSRLDPSLISHLRHVAELKEGGKAQKRKQTLEDARQRRKHRRLEDIVPHPSNSSDPHHPDYLKLPTREQYLQRHRDFIERTSNAALQLEVCVCCARELGASDGQSQRLCTVPNIDLLVPFSPHPAHRLLDGRLLVLEKISGEGDAAEGWFCSECLASLAARRLPPLSLSNGMWIGDVPEELSQLSIPEQLLIALHFPRCFVFKLHPRNRGSNDPDSLQRGMTGNVSTYAMNTNEIAQMLEGNKMPRPTSVLASLIAVTFIGQGTLPKRWIKSTFRVRRLTVYRALCWLKKNHSSYGNIELDPHRISLLPEDDVPIEITAACRQETDTSLVERESDSYVPTHSNLDCVDTSNFGGLSFIVVLHFQGSHLPQ